MEMHCQNSGHSGFRGAPLPLMAGILHPVHRKEWWIRESGMRPVQAALHDHAAFCAACVATLAAEAVRKITTISHFADDRQ